MVGTLALRKLYLALPKKGYAPFKNTLSYKYILAQIDRHLKPKKSGQMTAQ